MSSRAYRIAAIGEVLWDVFPTGRRFGGAPANFACSLAGLGREKLQVFMVSAVGDDQLGADAVSSLREHGVDTTHVATREEQTGQVLIELDVAGSASYEFAANCAWDHVEWTQRLARLATEIDVVCFGTLGQRSTVSRECVQQFVATTAPTALRIFDINLRPPFYSDDVIIESLELANVLKLNDVELPVLCSLCGLNGGDIEQVAQLADEFQLEAIALTRGPAGSLLWRDGETDEHPGVSTEIADTVGAGDAFTSAFTLGLLENQQLSVINRMAGELASFVCSQPGATPAIPRTLFPGNGMEGRR